MRRAGHRSVCKTASRGFEFRRQCAEIHITLCKEIALNVKGIVLCAREVFGLVLVVSDDAHAGKHDPEQEIYKWQKRKKKKVFQAF